jgi:arabinan endo-1,5-alpha-L-arabinosidase
MHSTCFKCYFRRIPVIFGVLLEVMYLVVVYAHPVLAQTTDVPIHDPVMIRQGDTYYAFGTGSGIPIWSSTDMVTWTKEAPVFSEAPSWIFNILPKFPNRYAAPDVYLNDGTYYLYYSVTTFGRNNSAIGVATNTTLDSSDPVYKWRDQGMVVHSVPGRDMWNTIDSNVIRDDDGTPWMVFGSHWGGIKLVRLEPGMTKIESALPDREWHTIAARQRYWKLDDRDAGDAANPDLDYEALYPTEVFKLNRLSESGAIEAPFLFRKNGFYYLFASWDRCCRGINSTYKVVVGRSKDIRGPYLDRTEENMTIGGGTMVVDDFETSKRWAAGGHSATYTFDGKDYLVFHAYDKTDEGRSKLVIHEIEWDEYGWPSVSLKE